MSESSASTAKRFFEMLFGPVLDNEGSPGQYLLVWSAPGKRSTFCLDVGSAVNKVMDLHAAREDVYFGCGSTNKRPKGGRGTKKGITAIFGCWSDLDVEWEGMKPGKKRAKDFEAAYRVLRNCRLEPSVIVHSGHGLQPYWLFDEPWFFHTDDERDQATEFMRRWDLSVRQYAQEDGWTTDTVFDLTRVFRVPGTSNFKGEVKPVQLLLPAEGEKPKRYKCSEIEEVFVPEARTLAAQESKRKVSTPINFSLPEDLTVEKPDFIEAMCENDPVFQRTWLKQRDDELDDYSASGYDLSIATQLCQAGFTQEEVFRACYAWRARYGHNPEKLKRVDYWSNTIGLAIASAKKSKDVNQLLDQFDAAPEYNPSRPDDYKEQQADDGQPKIVPTDEEKAQEDDEPPAEAREKPKLPIRDIDRNFYKAISDGALHVQVDHLLQHGRENARFTLVMADGIEVPLGERRKFRAQADFLGAISQVAKVDATPVDGKTWPRFLNKLISMAAIVENLESNRDTMMIEILSEYLPDQCSAVEKGGDDFKLKLVSSSPFVMDGTLHVNNASLVSWINARRILGSAVKKPDVDDMLRCAGFTCMAKQFSVRVRGARVHRRYWSARMTELPESFRYLARKLGDGHGDNGKKIVGQQNLFKRSGGP